jgi:hypothetical protein
MLPLAACSVATPETTIRRVFRNRIAAFQYLDRLDPIDELGILPW